MRVAFAADHAGAALKDELPRALAGPTLATSIDLGGDGSDPEDDYPDFAQRLGAAIQAGDADRGILICGSGVGASVAANKIRGHPGGGVPRHVLGPPGRRARRHEVLTLGSRVIGPEPAFECAMAFLAASFGGEPRHRRRLAKVLAIEASGDSSE